ncbi:hypothetical protein KUH32_09775 [Thalassococcus sp. CAU 1522]|uniref:Uncharacterized protein n=1 Tax=Thalassococcus arenae TaxID=2851652 RepID=A0ABS6N8P9_9RHOB|nr:hypothetical protein [Thalassococcus arenae]MBV2360062.1 hypothetical protein [Thalassococcus arenae]
MTMKRWMTGCVAALSVAGCMQAAPSTGPSASTDGHAAKLRPGMSPNDAFLTFGPESGFERNPANWDESCLSYAYGPAEQPRYVHARFVNDALATATDGHPGICSYTDAPVTGQA